MSFYKLLWLLAVLCIVVTGCKKDGDDDTNEGTAEKLATILTIQDGAMLTFKEEFIIAGDTVAAFNAMGQWIIQQDAVEEAFYVDDYLVRIHYKNGLKSSILLTPMDVNGQHTLRGGGQGNALKKFGFKTNAAAKIKNEKVLVLNPFIQEFYAGSYTKAPQFEGGVEDLEVTIVNGSDVGLQQINTFGDYGFVILNTHGLPNGFFLFNLYPSKNPENKEWTADEVLQLVAAQFNVPIEKFANGELEFAQNGNFEGLNSFFETAASIIVTENYVRAMNTDLSGTVLFANHCYSGQVSDGDDKNNMSQAWRSKGLSTYYGYTFDSGISFPVDNIFAKRMEDSLILNLVKRGDTTGIAHLAPDGSRQFYQAEVSPRSQIVKIENAVPYSRLGARVPFYFEHYFEQNYQYGGCSDTMMDVRDMQVYNTVCIGSQVWMAQNLNWAGAGVCYDGNANNCNTYGRLYTITEVNNLDTSSLNPSGVQGICPSGWHVPSRAEYEELFDYCGGRAQAGIKLRAQTGWSVPDNFTDEFGFNFLPGGLFVGDASTSAYQYSGQAGYLWTTTPNATNETFFIINAFESNFDFNDFEPPSAQGLTYKFSCRCVKD